MLPHASDGEIIAFLDGEHASLAESVRRHLEECDACRERRDRFSEYATFVHTELSTISVPVVDQDLFAKRVASRARTSKPVWRRPRWVAAAAVAGLAAVATASPARRWLRSFVDRPAVNQSAQPTISPAMPKSSSGGSVSFVPTSAIFTLLLDSVPAAGVLVVETARDDKITASVVSGAATGGDAFVVLPAELRIRNTTQARASYHIAVPRSVTQFRAIVAGSVIFDGSAPASITLSRR
jgi:predicted anti-sigma-YlaC factor YlaD